MIIINILYNTDEYTMMYTQQHMQELYQYIKKEFDNNCKIIIIPVKNQSTEIKVHDTDNNFSLNKLEKELYKLCNTNNKFIKNSIKNILRYIKIKKLII